MISVYMRLNIGHSHHQLVLSTTGNMGKVVATFYKRISSLFSDNKMKISLVIGWLHCMSADFALLKASIMCIRGACSSKSQPVQWTFSLLTHVAKYFFLKFFYTIFVILLITLLNLFAFIIITYNLLTLELLQFL